MRQSALFSGIIYIILGILFIFFAIQDLGRNGGEWGFFTYAFVMLATFDIGSGIRMILFHMKLRSIESNKK